MPSIPGFLQAKQLSVLSVTPQIPGAGGLLTAGTTFSVKAAGIFDTFQFRPTKNVFQINNSDALIANNQTGVAGFTASLGTLDKEGKVNPLIDLFMNGSDYIQLTTQCTTRSGAAGGTLSMYALIADMDTGIVEQRNGTIITLVPCGIAPIWTPPT